MVTKKLKNIPKIKLKKLGRPFARDIKGAARVGKKILTQKLKPTKIKSIIREKGSASIIRRTKRR